ncbi:MAG TPA: hypothetical protein VKS01_01890 [Bryobacteraceae bacterium]|nr:hypothetical protein [Bryobacteraceae bacterium]
MILVIFLISAGAMEWILWRHRKREAARPEPSPDRATRDLLGLAQALDDETARVDVKSAEYNRENAGVR